MEEMQHTVKFDPAKMSEIVTTGPKTVCFWSWAEFSLDGYVGKITKADFGRMSGRFTSTIFLPGTGNAITTTQGGAAILWETQYATVLVEAKNEKQMRSISKIITLVETGINFATTSANGYLVIACNNGAVRFYDYYLRLESWFEDLSAGPVTSVSFGIQTCPYPAAEAGIPGLKFWVPDFIVGTSDAFIVGVESFLFDEIRPDDRRGTLLMQGMSDCINSVACHPFRPLVTLACNNGALQMWDYDMKLLMNLREFNVRQTEGSTAKAGSAAARFEARNFLRPSYLAFEPNGEFLAVAFTSGHVKFVNVETFEDMASYAPSTDAILHLKFSPSGVYLAAFDSNNHVLLFQKSSTVDPQTSAGELNNPGTEQFLYIGRSHSHSAAITGIEFGMRDGLETLVSVGEDRRCVEYDLEVSSVISGLMTVEQPAQLLDLIAVPKALMWHPRTGDDAEDKFVVVNDEFKLKEFNAESKICRKTTLAPTFGEVPNCLIPIKSGEENFFVYSTKSKVIGIGSFPLTGNPTKVMGLVAHPAQISSIAVSFDAKFVFSAGGADLSVNTWAIDISSLSNQSIDADGEMCHFLGLLEGGPGGALHNDIVDYFYYCQLRTQGEKAMESRAVVGTIPVEEIPSLVRAVGFYPSEEEAANMMNEVRYKTFMVTGQLNNTIALVRVLSFCPSYFSTYFFCPHLTLPSPFITTPMKPIQNDFIMLYLNHRPVLPLNNDQITAAFETVCSHMDGGGAEIAWGKLKELLVAEGESISPSDLETFLAALLGGNADGLRANTLFDPRSFADEVLGFEN